MMKPRLPRQVATRPPTAEDGWRAQYTQEATLSARISPHVKGKIIAWLHRIIIILFVVVFLLFFFLIDVAG